MITEDHVSAEVAKLLRDKGFDEPVLFTINDEGLQQYPKNLDFEYLHNSELPANRYACPTIQMALRWLREVYRIDITVDPHDVCGDWIYQFHLCKDKKYRFSRDISLSYEDCAEEAIKYCLENLMNK